MQYLSSKVIFTFQLLGVGLEILGKNPCPSHETSQTVAPLPGIMCSAVMSGVNCRFQSVVLGERGVRGGAVADLGGGGGVRWVRSNPLFCLEFTLKAWEMATPMFQILKIFQGTMPPDPPSLLHLWRSQIRTPLYKILDPPQWSHMLIMQGINCLKKRQLIFDWCFTSTLSVVLQGGK